jgi:hypothetical protein
MHTPQILLIMLFTLDAGITLAHHGKPKEGKHNIVMTLIGTAIHVAILYWGGFFG